ncbi:MAG: cation diffusion facilitator family transporter [Planctomycetota bacterium]|nr:cation diffusion facilitator family transporter [Planctomycetota bacterium]
MTNSHSTHASLPNNTPEANREKRIVAISSVAAAVLLVLMKLVVGISTNSLGILSEALHSGLDFVAATITLWAVHISARPADRDHTYGHGKFENLSALLETLLLLATCGWIVYEAGQRLLFAEDVVVHANIWAFGVVIVSIVIDFSRWRALDRVAKKYDSQALEADALHFSTDILSSFVVLLGLLGVLLAGTLDLPWLEKADAVAALGVALIVIWVSIRLGRRAVDDLLDRVPPGMQDAVSEAAAKVTGVEEVKRVRLRRGGPLFFADITLTVDYAARLESAHQLADRVEAAVRAVLPNVDVIIHVEPGDVTENDLFAAIRVCAARHGLEAHAIRVLDESEGRSVELHIEVPGTLKLEEAHQQATAFENDLRRTMPQLTAVVTHIEPDGDTQPGLEARTAAAAQTAQIETAIRRFAQTETTRFETHDLKVQTIDDELNVSFHCTLEAQTPITTAHELTQRLECFLRAEVPRLARVVIHVEPD